MAAAAPPPQDGCPCTACRITDIGVPGCVVCGTHHTAWSVAPQHRTYCCIRCTHEAALASNAPPAALSHGKPNGGPLRHPTLCCSGEHGRFIYYQGTPSPANQLQCIYIRCHHSLPRVVHTRGRAASVPSLTFTASVVDADGAEVHPINGDALVTGNCQNFARHGHQPGLVWAQDLARAPIFTFAQATAAGFVQTPSSQDSGRGNLTHPNGRSMKPMMPIIAPLFITCENCAAEWPADEPARACGCTAADFFVGLRINATSRKGYLQLSVEEHSAGGGAVRSSIAATLEVRSKPRKPKKGSPESKSESPKDGGAGSDGAAKKRGRQCGGGGSSSAGAGRSPKRPAGGDGGVGGGGGGSSFQEG